MFTGARDYYKAKIERDYRTLSVDKLDVERPSNSYTDGSGLATLIAAD